MKSNIKVDMKNEKLIVSKTYYKKAAVYGTKEYFDLHSVMKDNPGFEIEFKAPAGRHYGKLTFGRMKEYIERQPESERRLKELETVKSIAKIKGSSYPIVKQWFLKTFPDFKESTTDEEIMTWDLKEMEHDDNTIEQSGVEMNRIDAIVNVA